MLPESIAGAAERFGGRDAFVFAGREPVTFAELHARSDRAASAMVRDGVGEGSVAALMMASGIEYVVAYLALAKLGAITAGVNTRMSVDERQRVLDRLRPDVVLESVPYGDGALPTLDPNPDRVVTVVFTSGTSGEPKGAVFTNRQLEAITRIDAGGLDVWGTGGPMLGGTQFCHIGFMTKVQWYLRTGSTVLGQERWRAADALRLIDAHRVPGVGGVAAQIALMLRAPEFDRYDFSCVKSIFVGGGPSPAALVRDARRRFGAPYSVRYSSTETGGLCTATALDAPDEEVLHTVGRPRPGIEVRIDERGEIVVRSPTAMVGYWRDPERTAAAIDADGWVRTGDLGDFDDAGRLRIVGRTTDMYIRGGYNVHPQEVEGVLAEHPHVAAVAVAPRPDPVMGEVGVAVVVPRDAANVPTLHELRVFAGDRVAGYKLPEAIRIVDALPFTSMDKLDRAALRRLVE